MVIATGESGDEVVRTDRSCGCFDAGIRCVGASVRDVVADGAGEEERLLRHVAELPAERAEIDRPQVVAIGSNRPLVGVIETSDQLHHRRLAGAGLADERDGLPHSDLQVDLAKCLGRLSPRRVA